MYIYTNFNLPVYCPKLNRQACIGLNKHHLQKQTPVVVSPGRRQGRTLAPPATTRAAASPSAAAAGVGRGGGGPGAEGAGDLDAAAISWCVWGVARRELRAAARPAPLVVRRLRSPP